MRLTDHVTLNFNNMSTAAVFLDDFDVFALQITDPSSRQRGRPT
jgi:hypothetical protein